MKLQCTLNAPSFNHKFPSCSAENQLTTYFNCYEFIGFNCNNKLFLILKFKKFKNAKSNDPFAK